MEENNIKSENQTLKAELTFEETELIFAYRKLSPGLKFFARLFTLQLSGKDMSEEIKDLSIKIIDSDS